MKIDSQIKGITVVNRGGTAFQVMHCHGCKKRTEFSTKPKGFLPQQALFKFAHNKGWTPNNRGKHLCPDCKGKSVTENDVREPTAANKKEIFRRLDEVYDESHKRYVDGYTDNVIAKEMSVPRKWVSDMREDFFGPSGENVDMERLVSNIARISSDLTDKANKCLEVASEAEVAMKEVEALRKQLDAIKAAVGPYRAA